MRTGSARWLLFIGFGLIAGQLSLNAQGIPEKPPRPIEVTVSNLQNLNFGSFCYGDGSAATVEISPDGIRSSTGSVLLMSGIYTTALYDIQALPGTLITIINGPDVTLTNSNGGEIKLVLGASYPIAPLIATSMHTTVTIGGTLVLGPTSTAGSYSGTFSIIFMQE